MEQWGDVRRVTCGIEGGIVNAPAAAAGPAAVACSWDLTCRFAPFGVERTAPQQPSDDPCQQPAGAARDLSVEFQIDQRRGDFGGRCRQIADKLILCQRRGAKP